MLAKASLCAPVLACLVSVGGCGGGESAPPAAPTASSPSAMPPGDVTPATPSAAATPASTPGTWPFDAAPSEADRSAQLERLKKDPGPIKTNWTPPGKSDRYGHAEALIAASPETVKAKLVDYGHFKDLAGPKFKSVKVVDKQGQSTDVYFQLPIMKGMITIWYVTRFAPPRPAAGGEVIEGSFVKGNIKGMQIAFNIKPGTDDKSTTLVCDLVLQPNVPAPQSAIDEELRDACGDAVYSLRTKLGLPDQRPL